MTIPMQYFMAMLQGKLHFLRFNFLRVLGFGIPAAAFLVLAPAGRLTITTATVSYLVGIAATFLCSLYWTMSLIDSPIRFSATLGHSLVSFGLRSYLGNLTNMLNERLDQMAIGIFLNPVQLGLYVIAVASTAPAHTVGGSVAIPATPALARIASTEQARGQSVRYLAVATTLSIILAFPLFVLMPWLISFVYGNYYASAAPAARILLIGAVLISENRLMTALLLGLHRPLIASSGQAISLVLTALGLVLLLPAYGLIGAALTSLLAYLVATCYVFFGLARTLEIAVPLLLAEIVATSIAMTRKMASRVRTVNCRKNLLL